MNNQMHTPMISQRSYLIAAGLLTALLIIWSLAQKPVLLMKGSALLGLADEVRAADSSFYKARVQVVLDEYCVSCHGATKVRGKLRLDDFVQTRYSGESSNVIPGSADKSELIARLHLPKEDLRSMPPLGLPQPSDDDITVLSLWIDKGASPDLASDSFPEAPELVEEVKLPVFDAAKIREARAGNAEAVALFQSRYAHALNYIAADSPDLRLTNVAIGDPFDDTALNETAQFADHIVSLEIRGKGITRGCIPALLSMTRLQELRLRDTALDEDSVLQIIKALDHVTWISLDRHLETDSVVEAARKANLRLYWN